MPDHAHGYDKLSDSELLAKVMKGWRCDETPCGTGSALASTALLRSHLTRITKEYDIDSVADAGAGDLHWIPFVRWDVDYRPFDLYPRHIGVTKFDITKEVLPKSDLILCRHVLNHLSIRMSDAAIRRFRTSRSKYLLMTNCDNQREYWAQYGLSIGDPIKTFSDCQHWQLELYEL
jgi:hypothetical protein